MERATRETWTQRVDAWRASGLTAQGYAAQQGLNAKTLRAWSSRLNRARASAGRCTQRDAAEDVGLEKPLCFLFLESRLPASGGEVEDAPAGPRRKETEEVAQIAPRLDAVQLAAGEQRNENGVDLARVVVADEHPVPPSGHFPTQSALADVVANRQPSVIEETLERSALIARVADCLGNGRLVDHLVDLRVTPSEEFLDDGARLALADA